MERAPSRSHGGAVGFNTPPGVTVNQVPLEKNLGSMMPSGELDAVIFYLHEPEPGRPQHRRPEGAIPTSSRCSPIRAEGVRWHRKSGIFPINHGMVVKREIAERHRWAVPNLLEAFIQANELAENASGWRTSSITSRPGCSAGADKALAERSSATASRRTARCPRRSRSTRPEQGLRRGR